MPVTFPMSPLQIIPNHPGTDRGISLYIKRDDLLHPEIDGSKGRKLAPVLSRVKAAYPGGIITFGGAFSNHLQAVAVAGRIFGIPTIGILRGAYADLNNATLLDCQANGMQLRAIPRNEYDGLKDTGYEAFSAAFPDCYVLPEGGNTPEAVVSCAHISREILTQLAPIESNIKRYCCVPAGTGCTAAGVIAGFKDTKMEVLVFPVSNHGLNKEAIQQLLPDFESDLPDFRLVEAYVFGGFAKLHSPVMEFARSFLQQTNIRLDPIYTAKMCFGVFDLLAKDAFEPDSTVIMLHTGGMQGWKGFQQRYGAAGTL